MYRSTLLLLLFSLSVIPCAPMSADEASRSDKITTSPTTNEPKDPFPDLKAVETAPSYAREVDRTRGSFTITAKDGAYLEGSHFSSWNWTMSPKRWGNYYAGLVYDSTRAKLGIQLRIGSEATLKGYAPRTNPIKEQHPMVLGLVYLPKTGEYPVALLAGDRSNVPDFRVKAVHFQPAPESEVLGQSIDGTIELTAKSATTYSESMRYEPKPEKNCLGFWKEQEDWAEWVFDVSQPGQFEVLLEYGCGSGKADSRAAVLINDQTLEFTIADTGGYQSWREISVGTVHLKTKGENHLAILPLKLTGAALMDVRKVLLRPVPAVEEKNAGAANQ